MTTSRRALHVIDLLDEYSAGAAIGELAFRLGQAGWHSSVVALRATSRGLALLRATGVNVMLLRRRWLVDPVVAGRIRNFRLAARFDIIHCWDLTALAYVAIGAGEAKLPPLILGVDEDETRRPWAKVAMRRFSKRVVQALADDERTAVWCETCGLAKSKITVRPPGVAANTEPPFPREEFLNRSKLPSDARVIAVAGKIRRENHVEEAIWRYELVRVLHPNARLIVFGDGDDGPRIERFTRLVSDLQGVRLLGYREEIRQMLPHVDVFWSCRTSGSTPRTLLEAMHAGVPVVAGEVAAARRVICHRRDGMLVDPWSRGEFARQTDELLRDRALADQIGSAGAKQATTRFLFQHSLEKCLQAYESHREPNLALS